MLRGIIYKRVSPSGAAYVGQTTNEYNRQQCWAAGKVYSGKRTIIDRARKKYGADAFEYHVLIECFASNKRALIRKLNRLEIKLIWQHQTHCSQGGYNMTLGGRNRQVKLTARHRANISKAGRGKVPSNLHTIQQSERTKQANRDRGRPVLVYTINDVFVSEYHSTNAACIALGLNRGSASHVISGKCRHTRGYTLKIKEED